MGVAGMRAWITRCTPPPISVTDALRSRSDTGDGLRASPGLRPDRPGPRLDRGGCGATTPDTLQRTRACHRRRSGCWPATCSPTSATAGPSGSSTRSTPRPPRRRDGSDSAYVGRCRQVDGPTRTGDRETELVRDDRPATGRAVRPGCRRREAEVLALITQDLSDQQIADRAYLDVDAVQIYVRSVYAKIGVTRQSQAVVWGISERFRARHGAADRSRTTCPPGQLRPSPVQPQCGTAVPRSGTHERLG